MAEVAAFFRVAKRSSIGDGREAQMLFRRYLSTYSAKQELKDELILNLDDLEALVETQRAIQKLPIERERARPRNPSSLACTPSSAVLQILIAVTVIFLVLLHSGEDAGLSGAFGIGGGAAPWRWLDGRAQPGSGHDLLHDPLVVSAFVLLKIVEQLLG